MPSRIEDYALIGNCESAAMVGRNGSIDWLALPRFDSAACFAALLGGPENGRWQIAPTAEGRVTRHYRQGALVLETRFETEDGAALLIDGMGRRDGCGDLVRIWRPGRCPHPSRRTPVPRCGSGPSNRSRTWYRFPRHILFGSRKKGPVQSLGSRVAAGENPSLRPQSNATTSRSGWVWASRRR
jgi:hypothetical protein